MLDIIGTNISMIDDNIYRKIMFISSISNLFDMKFVIGDKYLDDFNQFELDCLRYTNLDELDESFSLSNLLAIQKNKLFVISDINSVLDSKLFKTMIVNSSQFKCTIIIFDGLDIKLKTINNIKINTNILIGSFSYEQIISSYNIYFTMFPTFDIYEKHIMDLKKIKPMNYISVLKSGKRYYSIDERFKIIDIDINSIINDTDCDETVYNKIIKYDLCISVEI